MEQKPSVFPTQLQKEKAANEAEIAKLEAYEREKLEVTHSIYNASTVPPTSVDAIPLDYAVGGHIDAVEAMRRRTEYQMNLRAQIGEVKYPELAEKPPVKKITKEEMDMQKRNEEQMRLRDEALARNQAQTNKYHQQSEASMSQLNNPNKAQNMNQNTQGVPNNYQPSYVPPTPPTPPSLNNGYGENYGKNPSNINSTIFELSQPNYNSPFDVLPLPSQGKLYKSKKPGIRVSYMTTADENILTSPNLLESGEFLEILMNRKILEPELRYKDLVVGDRNAVMLWLRATAYGEMYPVTIFDENNVPFDVEINLNELKTKKLGAEPDSEGLFDFQFPLSKDVIKFKFLTVGETEDIEKRVEDEKNSGSLVNNSSIYILQKQIVSVNGERNPEFIRDYTSTIRISDAKKLTEYIEKIESGIDLNVTVGTPGGGSVTSFLPLNFNFFWPNIKL